MLTMALLAPVVVAATLLEDDDLVGPALVFDLGGDRRAFHQRRANFSGFAANHQHFGELHPVADFSGNFFDFNDIVGGNTILLTAGLDDRVHGRPHSSPRPVAPAPLRNRTFGVSLGQRLLSGRLGRPLTGQGMAEWWSDVNDCGAVVVGRGASQCARSASSAGRRMLHPGRIAMRPYASPL